MELGSRSNRAMYTYAGVRFASQLEVRWAQLMVALNVLSVDSVRGSYEFFRVKMGSGVLVTPDFYLHGADVFFEVKGDPSIEDWNRLLRLEEGTGIPVYVAVGTIPKAHRYPEERFVIHRPTNNIVYTWTVCPHCQTAYIAPQMIDTPSGERIPADSGGCWSCGRTDHEATWIALKQGRKLPEVFKVAQAFEIASGWQNEWQSK